MAQSIKLDKNKQALTTAHNFWKSRIEYPIFADKKRRLHELEYLTKELDKADGKVQSLLDLGCGAGDTLELLYRTVDIPLLVGADYSESLLKLVNPKIKTFVYDLNYPNPLPFFDVIVVGGVIQYIFDDNILKKALKEMADSARTVYFRTACTREANDVLIDKYSENLEANYASKYRTLDNTLEILQSYFDITVVSRAYPDELESKYNTYQWWIKTIPKSYYQ